MVTPQGFNALLKLVEEPPEHVKFIFATTEPEKVIGTIRSRTHHYPFRLVPPATMLEYIEQLCTQESVSVAPGVLPLVVRAGGGSVRDTLSLLDQLMAGSEDGAIAYERAVALLGYTDAALLDDVVDALAVADPASAFSAIDRVVQTGQDPRRFVEDLLERLRDLIVVAATNESAGAVLRGISPEELDTMSRQAGVFGATALSRGADIANRALTEMTGATSPRLHLELMVARMLVPEADDTQRGALARVERLERRVGVGDAGGHQAPPETMPAATSPPDDVRSDDVRPEGICSGGICSDGACCGTGGCSLGLGADRCVRRPTGSGGCRSDQHRVSRCLHCSRGPGLAHGRGPGRSCTRRRSVLGRRGPGDRHHHPEAGTCRGRARHCRRRRARGTGLAVLHRSRHGHRVRARGPLRDPGRSAADAGHLAADRRARPARQAFGVGGRRDGTGHRAQGRRPDPDVPEPAGRGLVQGDERAGHQRQRAPPQRDHGPARFPGEVRGTRTGRCRCPAGAGTRTAGTRTAGTRTAAAGAAGARAARRRCSRPRRSPSSPPGPRRRSRLPRRSRPSLRSSPNSARRRVSASRRPTRRRRRGRLRRSARRRNARRRKASRRSAPPRREHPLPSVPLRAARPGAISSRAISPRAARSPGLRPGHRVGRRDDPRVGPDDRCRARGRRPRVGRALRRRALGRDHRPGRARRACRDGRACRAPAGAGAPAATARRRSRPDRGPQRPRPGPPRLPCRPTGSRWTTTRWTTSRSTTARPSRTPVTAVPHRPAVPRRSPRQPSRRLRSRAHRRSRTPRRSRPAKPSRRRPAPVVPPSPDATARRSCVRSSVRSSSRRRR